MKVISRNKVKDFLYHKVDGFIATQKGINSLFEQGIIDAKVYKEMIDKNTARLAEKVSEWRILEKMSCIFFAVLFTWNATAADPEELIRRGRRSSKRAKREVYYE